MQEPANGSRYILSEVEVMGKGGLVAQPVAPPPASKGKIILSGGNWELQRASEVTASGEEISTPGYKPENWIVATVPGTVLSSYKNRRSELCGQPVAGVRIVLLVELLVS